jgi:hypothetical protein
MLVRGLAHWVPEDRKRVEEQTAGGVLRRTAAQAPGVIALNARLGRVSRSICGRETLPD